MAVDNTKDRIVHATSELFRQQGYNATASSRSSTEAAGAVRLAVPLLPARQGAARRRGDPALRRALRAADPGCVRPGAGPRHRRTGLLRRRRRAPRADRLRRRVPDRDGRARGLEQQRADAEACAEVFERWIARRRGPVRRRGRHRGDGRELTIGMLRALEGAFVLARAARSTEPLRIAGEMVGRTPSSEPRRVRRVDSARLPRDPTALGAGLGSGAARRRDARARASPSGRARASRGRRSRTRRARSARARARSGSGSCGGG